MKTAVKKADIRYQCYNCEHRWTVDTNAPTREEAFKLAYQNDVICPRCGHDETCAIAPRYR